MPTLQDLNQDGLQNRDKVYRKLDFKFFQPYLVDRKSFLMNGPANATAKKNNQIFLACIDLFLGTKLLFSD